MVAPPVWMSEAYAPGISPEDEDPVRQARAFAEDFRISLGGQIVSSINTSVRVDGPNRGTEVSLEDELGFKSEVSVFRVDAAWRMTGRHNLIASYYDISRTSSKVIDREIEFKGETYELGATLEGFFDTQTYKLAYGYSFHEGEEFAIAASGGFHVMSLATGMRRLDGPANATKASVTAPLPVLGLHGDWRFADRWRGGFSAEVFGIKIDSFSGTLLDAVMKVEYELTSYAALGLGYNYFDMNLKLEGSNLTGRANFGYDGLLFFLRGGF